MLRKKSFVKVNISGKVGNYDSEAGGYYESDNLVKGHGQGEFITAGNKTLMVFP